MFKELWTNQLLKQKLQLEDDWIGQLSGISLDLSLNMWLIAKKFVRLKPI